MLKKDFAEILTELEPRIATAGPDELPQRIFPSCAGSLQSPSRRPGSRPGKTSWRPGAATRPVGPGTGPQRTPAIRG